MVRQHFTEYTDYIKSHFPRDKVLSAREVYLYVGDKRKEEGMNVISYDSVRYHLELLVKERILYKQVFGIINNKCIYGWKK